MSSSRISSPPEKPEDDPYFCQCQKCALRGGRILSRSAWYLHNPGGRGVKLPKLSLEEAEYILNLPASKLTRTRQRHLDERRLNLRARISKRDIGSSSVRMTSLNICAAIFRYL